MLINNNLSQIVARLTGSLKPAGRYTPWRVISIIVVGLMLLVALGTTYFIYRNIYNTLANANAVVILNANLNSDVIDLPAFEKAQAIIEQKNTPVSLPEKLRNMFIYETTTSTTATGTKP